MAGQRNGISRRTIAKGGMAAVAGAAASSRFAVPAVIAFQGDGEISFMNWDTVADTPLETALNTFQEQTGITVNVQPTPTGEYETKMRTLIASGSPPDVMRINDDFVRGYSLTGQILDLNPYIEQSGINPDEYNEHPYRFPIQPDGTHMAWTLGTQPAMIFYNVSMFEEAGVTRPPGTWTDKGWTWDDFLETAKQLTDAGQQRWGALVYDDTSSETVYTVNNGEPTGIYSEDGTEFTLANPAAIEGIQWITDLACVHEVQPPWSQLQQDQAGNQLFASGRVGMIERTFGTAAYFRNNVSEFTWDVAPVPANVSQTTIATLIDFCIPKSAGNPDAAWELLKFLGGVEGGRIFAEAGVWVPAHKEAAASLQALDGTPEHIALVTEAVQHSTNENFSEHIERARQIYRPQLDLIFNCEKSAEEVLTSLRADVEAALAGEM
ncbi:MAG TPA: sugar ABC transporter substrate-binding protein [Thermomicrobiales bacterium]|nr:sugar ABC transporter substrate-binding protein [Thermomicrobiales bacterium]